MPYPAPSVDPSGGLYPADEALSLVIRERPPLRLMLDVQTPDGRHVRWGADEHDPANVPTNLTFSSTMPGGFDQLSVTLPRKPGIDYSDLEEFSTITASGLGETAWQGRLETSPRASGDQMAITPGAVGWQAALDDNQSARMIYVSRDLNAWTSSSVALKLADLANGIDPNDPAVTPDPTGGQPSMTTSVTGVGSRGRVSQAWFSGLGIPIQSLYYAWQRTSTISTTDVWDWEGYLANDDQQNGLVASGNLKAAGPGTGTVNVSATDVSKKFASVALTWFAAGGADGVLYAIYWTCLAVYGQHDLPKRGSEDYTNAKGFYASDVIYHAVTTWAPKLAVARAGQSTIEPTSFVIPHLVFTDPTTASAIVKEALKYELLDWWVDEGPTFNLASRSSHGRKWRARVGPSGLQETGPQVDRIYNSVLVSYQDVDGTNRTVGPPGSTADVTDSSLVDPDPENPVTAAGLTRRFQVQGLGTSTPAAAIQVGRAWLADQRARSTAGQAQIVGHVEDEHGVWWPAWMLRAGDWISFVDAHDPVYRRIVRASYNHDSRACQIDLDSPPEGLAALLARMSDVLVPLGLT